MTVNWQGQGGDVLPGQTKGIHRYPKVTTVDSPFSLVFWDGSGSSGSMDSLWSFASHAPETRPGRCMMIIIDQTREFFGERYVGLREIAPGLCGNLQIQDDPGGDPGGCQCRDQTDAMTS